MRHLLASILGIMQHSSHYFSFYFIGFWIVAYVFISFYFISLVHDFHSCHAFHLTFNGPLRNACRIVRLSLSKSFTENGKKKWTLDFQKHALSMLLELNNVFIIQAVQRWLHDFFFNTSLSSKLGNSTLVCKCDCFGAADWTFKCFLKNACRIVRHSHATLYNLNGKAKRTSNFQNHALSMLVHSWAAENGKSRTDTSGRRSELACTTSSVDWVSSVSE